MTSLWGFKTVKLLHVVERKSQSRCCLVLKGRSQSGGRSHRGRLWLAAVDHVFVFLFCGCHVVDCLLVERWTEGQKEPIIHRTASENVFQFGLVWTTENQTLDRNVETRETFLPPELLEPEQNRVWAQI